MRDNNDRKTMTFFFIHKPLTGIIFLLQLHIYLNFITDKDKNKLASIALLTLDVTGYCALCWLNLVGQIKLSKLSYSN